MLVFILFPDSQKYCVHQYFLYWCLLQCPCVCLFVCLFVRLFTFEVTFKRLFAPTSQSWMYKVFIDSESLGKYNTKFFGKFCKDHEVINKDQDVLFCNAILKPLQKTSREWWTSRGQGPSWEWWNSRECLHTKVVQA